MPEKALNVQNQLNLVLPLLPGSAQPLLVELNELNTRAVNPLQDALVSLGNVHFAQFVLLEGGTRLGVFTIFDGSFDDYILSFTQHIGDVFNAILKHVGDGAELVVPVQQNRDAFLQFIKAHNAQGLGLFSAYPNRRLFDIRDALAEART
jgi:hypothetical protein